MWSFGVFAVATGLANGISAGVVQVMGADLAPADCRGEFLGIFRMLGKGADLVSPLLIGVMADICSLEVAELVICFVGLFGALWVLNCVAETLRPEGEETKGTTIDSLPAVAVGKPTNGMAKFTKLEEELELDALCVSVNGTEAEHGEQKSCLPAETMEPCELELLAAEPSTESQV